MVPVQNAITQALNPTGIHGTDKDKEFKLFPNPVKGAVNIDFILPQSSDVTITISDIQGAVVKTVTHPKQASGHCTLTVDLDKALRVGNYFLEINAGQLSGKAIFTLTR